MRSKRHQKMNPQDIKHIIEAHQSEGVLSAPCACKDPADVVACNELRQALTQAMRKLTAREVQVVTRVAVGASPEEIAQELSLSTPWVKKLERRGLNKLRVEASRPGRKLACYCSCNAL